MLRYIRQINNPLKVLAYGYVGPGGLGEFDAAIYEEVEGDLPEGWEKDNPPLPLPDRLLKKLDDASKAITSAIEQGATPPPVGIFTQIATLSVTLQEVARMVPPTLYAPEANAAITALGVLPDPLESIRQDILNEIAPELPPPQS